jgi:DNA-binding response OmpR family regulator
VIDDDQSMRDLVRLYLSNAGYSVAMAEDAVAARRMLVGSTPDLLIVDVDMPHLNGLEFVRWMRADPNTRKVPVIFMTAFERFQPEATALGADCLLKPLVEKALVELVGRRF